MHALTDTSQAFGPLVASAIGADYRIHAYSGYGMVRNYDGNVQGENLPLLYHRAIPGDAESMAAADPAWQPRVIVIGLGGNDFSTPIKPAEAWRDAEALRTAYRDRYVAFVTELAVRNPEAHVILTGADLFFADVAAVAARLQSSLGTRVRMLRITGFELTGCQGHPSLADHRRMAALVGGALAAE